MDQQKREKLEKAGWTVGSAEEFLGQKLYIIYDGRAIDDVDSAEVLDTADTLEEARKIAQDMMGCVIYEYDVDGKNLINEAIVDG